MSSLSMWEDLSDTESLFSTNQEKDDEQANEKEPVNASGGSYHCKSALRTHDSNYKLFLYKRDFDKLYRMTNVDSYDEQYFTVLPNIWRSFTTRKHCLNGTIDESLSMTQTTPSPALVTFLDSAMLKDEAHKSLIEVLNTEAEALKWISVTTMINPGQIADEILKRMMNTYGYLMLFFNYCILVLNYRRDDNRPDMSVTFPGVCVEIDENIYLIKFNDHLYVHVSENCILLKAGEYEQLLQKDLFLTIADKVNERFNTLLMAELIDSELGEPTKFVIRDTPIEDRVPLLMAVTWLIKFGDNLVLKKKNRAFDLLSKFEAYCVSAIIRGDDPKIWKNTEFQENLLEAEKTDCPDLYPFAEVLVKYLNMLPVDVLSEVHGVWRIWGHPIIDLEGGLYKMEQTSLKKVVVDPSETKTGERTFKSVFFKSYREKHGHYPISNLTNPDNIALYDKYMNDRDRQEIKSTLKEPQNYVEHCIRSGKVISERSSKYHHSDWDNVVLYQNFQVPTSVNLATMIKDKAISMNRNDLATSVSMRNSVFDKTKRRGILRWLQEQAVRVKDYLVGVDESGIPDDDSIIGLYPKEREMKTKARFFSLMSYNLRMFVTITEELLGHLILPYFPMITMSDTLLNMIIRLYNMTTSIGLHSTHVTYSMNIDFSKWNQNMREATNDGIFKNLDRIMGFRCLISRTHSIFKRCYIYLCSGEYMPSIISGQLTTQRPYSRIGDESGKEGLRQKGWTITTVCDILSLAFEHKVKIELIGGGDNQVLTVQIRSPAKDSEISEKVQLANIQRRMERFRTALAKKMDKRGLPLKLEETWISHRLLMYNKIMYLNGVPLPGRLKVASRTFQNSNTGLMSLGNVLSTLGTNYQSISAKDYTPILAWVFSRVSLLLNMAQYWSFNPLSGVERTDRHIRKMKDNLKKGDNVFGSVRNQKPMNIKFTTVDTISCIEMYIIALYYHKSLGGPGIGSPYAYIMKSFPDPLSESLTFNYNVMNASRNQDLKRYITCLSTVNKAEAYHWEHLLEDPVSVNHDAPSHGVAALRKEAENVLRSTPMKNVRFKELLNAGDNEVLKKMSEVLCSKDILEPRLLHDIVGATIPGYVNSITSKVDQSTTISKIASGLDIMLSINEAEATYLLYLSRKIHKVEGIMLGSCPTRDAERIRNHSWGKKIIGVTTPHPAAFLDLKCHTNISGFCDQNYVMSIVKRTGREIARGPFRPYFGSYTKEKFKQTSVAAAYGDEDVLKRAIRIQKLLGWRYEEGTFMWKLIQGILSCVTNADPTKFLPDTNEITGDIEHRYSDMATKHGGIPTNLIHHYTTVSCNTSTFINHSKGASNETIHFQACIIYASMLSILKGIREDIITSVYHFHESCKVCIKEIERPTIADMDYDQEVNLVMHRGNDLMYVEEEMIPVHYHQIMRMSNEKDRGRYRLVKFSLDPPDNRMLSTEDMMIAYYSLLSSDIKESALDLMWGDITPNRVQMTVKYCVLTSQFFLGSDKLGTSSKVLLLPIVEKLYDRLRLFLSHSTVSRHLLDMGISPPDFIDDDEMYSSTLQCVYEICSLPLEYDNMRTAIACIHDPAFAYQRIMCSIGKNPSCVSCNNCYSLLKESLTSSGDQDLVCSIHGSVTLSENLHTYSLDKLRKIIKEIGISYHAPDQAEKRKRPTTIGDMMSPSKRRKLVISRKIKDNQRKRKISLTVVRKVLEATWNIWNISTPVCYQESSGEPPRRSYFHGDDNLIESRMSRKLSTIQCIFEGIYKEPADSTLITIGVEVRDSPSEVIDIPFIIKYLSVAMFNRRKRDDPPLVIRVKYLIYEMRNLEKVKMKMLQEIIYQTQIESLKNIEIVDIGEDSVDVIKAQRGLNFVVKTTTHGLDSMTRRAYLISTLGSVSDVQEAIRMCSCHFQTRLLTTQSTLSYDPPVIWELMKTDDIVYIDQSVMMEALVSVPTSPGAADIEILKDMTQMEIGGSSIYREMFMSMFIGSICVTTETLYKTTMAKLSQNICLEVLPMGENSAFSWRFICFMRLYISLMILCSNDPEEALNFYSQFDTVSIFSSSHKKFKLRKGTKLSKERRFYLNGSTSILGRGLVWSYYDMKSWLYTSYKAEISLKTVINI